jgi:hypothetical protein
LATDSERSARIRPLAVLGAVAGVLLFIYALQSAGPREILRQLRQVGFGFLLVLVLSAARMALRSKAWTLCVEDSQRFPFLHAFRAYIAGDAVGNVLPLGPLASEGTKALLSRRLISTPAAFSSVVLENIFYSLTVAVVVTFGTLTFLLMYKRGNAAITATVGIVTAVSAGIIAVWWLLRSQPRLLSRFLKSDAVRDAEDRVFRFSSTQKDRIWKILLLQFGFHAAAITEIYVLLQLLAPQTNPTAVTAVILGTVERVIIIAFKFVPFRLGVDHLGSGSAAEMLGIGGATGVAIATVRTARNMFWAAVGLGLLTRGAKKEGPDEQRGPPHLQSRI